MNTIIKNTVYAIGYVCTVVCALSLVGIVSVSGASVRTVVDPAVCDVFRNTLLAAAGVSAVGCFISGRFAK